MEHSIPDEIYHDIFGEYPKKSGTAYERLSSIALSIVKEQRGYVDQHIRGTYSDTSYQLDGKLESDIETSMVEAKDYTIDNKKVGRGDLQKLGGALPDLKEIDRGVFASATQYTKPAIKYANAAKDITGKPIELYEIRGVTSDDEKGRIKTIKVEINAYNLMFESGKYQPFFSKTAIDKLEEDGILGKPIQLRYQYFYDCQGNVVETLHNLTLSANKSLDLNNPTEEVIGRWDLKNKYMMFPNGKLYEVMYIDYSIPVEIIKDTIIIQSDGTPKLLIKSLDGTVNKLLTDKQLANYRISEEGELLNS